MPAPSPHIDMIYMIYTCTQKSVTFNPLQTIPEYTQAGVYGNMCCDVIKLSSTGQHGINPGYLFA